MFECNKCNYVGDDFFKDKVSETGYYYECPRCHAGWNTTYTGGMIGMKDYWEIKLRKGDL